MDEDWLADELAKAKDEPGVNFAFEFARAILVALNERLGSEFAFDVHGALVDRAAEWSNSDDEIVRKEALLLLELVEDPGWAEFGIITGTGDDSAATRPPE